jgi:hypothetical protein
VALSLETESVEKTLTEDVAASVEEESVDEELPDTSVLDVMPDEVATADSALVVAEISEDD